MSLRRLLARRQLAHIFAAATFGARHGHDGHDAAVCGALLKIQNSIRRRIARAKCGRMRSLKAFFTRVVRSSPRHRRLKFTESLARSYAATVAQCSFRRHGAVASLRQRRAARLDASATAIQRHFRGFLVRARRKRHVRGLKESRLVRFASKHIRRKMFYFWRAIAPILRARRTRLLTAVGAGEKAVVKPLFSVWMAQTKRSVAIAPKVASLLRRCLQRSVASVWRLWVRWGEFLKGRAKVLSAQQRRHVRHRLRECFALWSANINRAAVGGRWSV